VQTQQKPGAELARQVQQAVEAAYAHGVAVGRRELLEQVTVELRRRFAAWRSERSKGVRGALLHVLVESWGTDCEALCLALDQQAVQMRQDEERRGGR
jgi:hypothetical protein